MLIPLSENLKFVNMEVEIIGKGLVLFCIALFKKKKKAGTGLSLKIIMKAKRQL